jgi:hypothetical protein
MTQLARISGAALVAIGLLALAFGSLWAPRTLALVYDSGVSWPFDAPIPFLPIFAIALRAQLLVKSRR